MKTNWKFLLLFLFVILSISCEEHNDEPPNIIINGQKTYLYHYDDFTPWSETSEEVVLGNGAESETEGYLNSESIIEQYGEGDYAAYLCDTLTSDGLSNWYLPSFEELKTIFQEKNSVDFEWFGNYYWSSTELDSTYAKSVSMYNGGILYFTKVLSCNVVCISKE